MIYTTEDTIDIDDLVINASAEPYKSTVANNFHIEVKSGAIAKLYPITSYTVTGATGYEIGTLVFPTSTIAVDFNGDRKYSIKAYYASNANLDASGVALTLLQRTSLAKVTTVTSVSL